MTKILEYTQPYTTDKNDAADFPHERDWKEKNEAVMQVLTTPIQETTKKTFNLTDQGNAERLVAEHGDIIKYCYTLKTWLIWSGKHWKEDNTGEIIRLAKQTVRNIYGEAQCAGNENVRQSIAKHAGRSESERALNAMISLAKPEVPVQASELDDDPMLLAVNNGTLNLATGQLLPYRREDLITRFLRIDYEQNSACPQWFKFLDCTLSGDQETIDYIQRIFGYCLTGDVREQVLFFIYGPGANGKSTLVDMLMLLLGKYGVRLPSETIMLRQQNAVPNDLAMLKGARLAVTSEIQDGARLNEARIKDITGGDVITARKLYGEFFNWVPTHKLIIVGNHKPSIFGTDHAIWRRIHLLPFDFIIPEEQRDPELKTKLMTELPGILSWAARGCLDWQIYGLGVPKRVKQATATYQGENDILGQFIEECCSVSQTEQCASKQLFNKYKQWSLDNGMLPMTKNKLGRCLRERGFKDERKNGQREWRGIGC